MTILTYVDRCVAGLNILIQVGDAQRVEWRGSHAVQELAQHEDVAVGREACARAVLARLRQVAGAQARALRHTHLVGWRGEVGQCEHQRAQGHDQHPPAQPAGLVARAPKVADKGKAHAGCNVVGAGDETGLPGEDVCICDPISMEVHSGQNSKGSM